MKNLARRALPELACILVLVLLLPGAAWAQAEDVWPRPGLEADPAALRGGEATEHRFAAGLYRSLVQIMAEGNPRLLSPDDAARYTRALLTLGDLDTARELAARRDDLPQELALQVALGGDAADWSDLELTRWRGLNDGDDGESRYWQARLSLATGDEAGGRQGLEALLRREPGSIFAPAALELLQALPLASADASEEQASSSVLPGGPRVQWGVFGDARGAKRLRDALAAYGEPAELLRLRRDGAELYRVCSRPCTDEAEARALGELYRERYGMDFVLYREPTGGSAP